MEERSSIKKKILIIIILGILIPPIVLIIVSAIRFHKFFVELAQNKMEKAADEIDVLTNKSLSIAKISGNFFANTVSYIKNTLLFVKKINNFGREQKFGTRQVNHAPQQLNSVIQNNVESAEFSASKGQGLNSFGEELDYDIELFKINDFILKPKEKVILLKSC